MIKVGPLPEYETQNSITSDIASKYRRMFESKRTHAEIKDWLFESVYEFPIYKSLPSHNAYNVGMFESGVMRAMMEIFCHWDRERDGWYYNTGEWFA